MAHHVCSDLGSVSEHVLTIIGISCSDDVDFIYIKTTQTHPTPTPGIDSAYGHYFDLQQHSHLLNRRLWGGGGLRGPEYTIIRQCKSNECLKVGVGGGPARSQESDLYYVSLDRTMGVKLGIDVDVAEARGRRGRSLFRAQTMVHVRVDHLSNTTCLTQAFFESGEC